MNDFAPASELGVLAPVADRKQTPHDLLISADRSMHTLKTLLINQRLRMMFEEEEDPGEILKNVEKLKGMRAEIAATLAGWNHAYNQSKIQEGFTSTQEQYWSQKAVDYYDALDQVLWYGLPLDRLEQDEKIPAEDKDLLQNSGFGMLSGWAQDTSHAGRKNVIDFLNYELRYARMGAESAAQAGEPKLKYIFERKKELIIPVLSDALRVALASHDDDSITSVFENLGNIHAESEAAAMLSMEGLTDDQRLTLTVAHINTFGFIRTVDHVASFITTPGIADEKKQQLLTLYGSIQGEETRGIAAELSDVYKKIDFSNYHLNERELTVQEVDKIEAAIQGMEVVLQGTDPHKISIVDCGAGTGRHTLELSKRGYTQVTAYEFEPQHVDFIRKQDPSLKVIQGDWARLHDTLQAEAPERLPVQFLYSLGRTIAHNRTPGAMLHMFDEDQRVLDPKGRCMADVPAVDWGVYEERIQKLKKNLEAIGVSPLQSRLVFDGPNDIDRFNRMILKPNQVEAMGRLLGLKVIDRSEEVIGDTGEVKNVYYFFEKDEAWNPQQITPEEFHKYIFELGLFEPGMDLNLYVDAWGMTLGQARAYMKNFGLGNEYIRHLNEQGRGPQVGLIRDGNRMVLEGKGFAAEDFQIALAAKGKTKEEIGLLSRPDQTTPA